MNDRDRDTRDLYRDRGFLGRVGFGVRPAVLVVDFILGFTDAASPLAGSFDEEVAATGRLIEAARGIGAPVVFTTTAYDAACREAGVFVEKVPSLRWLVRGSRWVELDARLGRQDSDLLIEKQFASAFFATPLASWLASRHIDTVIVAGATTSGCVRASVVDALQHGFRAIVPRECVGDRAQGPHEANLLDIDGKYGDVMALSDVLDALARLRPAPPQDVQMTLPGDASIVEVGPRDGFQMERAFIPTAVKIAAIDAIAASGVRKIEATSFVSPKVIPQMRDAAEVMAGITRRPGIVYTALVPNTRGAEQAVAARVDIVRQVICVTETYNRRNVGMTVAASIENLRAIQAAAGSVPVELVIALAFGCPLEGAVDPGAVVRLAGAAVEMGVGEISIADSIGVAGPSQVASMMRRLQREFEGIAWSLHLHDTRGLGLANVLAGLDEGVTAFDASIGGMGGCPVVPGATGNIASEDLAHMFAGMGVATGIDIEGLAAAARAMQSVLGRELPGKVLSAGTTDAWFARARGDLGPGGELAREKTGPA